MVPRLGVGGVLECLRLPSPDSPLCITNTTKGDYPLTVVQQARRAIVLALFIGNAVGFVVTLIGQLNNVNGALGWSTVAISLLLALGFGYFQFTKPAPEEAPSFGE